MHETQGSAVPCIPCTPYQVARVKDPAAQADLIDRVISEGLSRAETAEAVRRASGRPKAKGKAGKTRKVTTRTFRKAAGCTVTVENAGGLDHGITRAALVQALARLDAEGDTGQAAA
jgi:hypothetical protein